MATSGQNLGGEKRKQIKNTCTSVTGIVDEVDFDIATHNKWGLKFGEDTWLRKRHRSITYIWQLQHACHMWLTKIYLKLKVL